MERLAHNAAAVSCGIIIAGAAVAWSVIAGCRQADRAVEMRDEWNTNFFLKPTYGTKPVEVATHFARAGASGGTVVLRDDSSWEVRAEDRHAAARWQGDSRVIVVESGDALWPYTIINLDTHDASSVTARRLE